MGSSLVNCSVCLFEQPPSDPQAFAETNLVTVINGQAVCLHHARMFPAGGDWRDMYDAIIRHEGTPVLPRAKE